MKAKAQKYDAVNAVVRNQLGMFHGAGVLQQAAKEWYESLDEDTRRQVEQTCMSIAGTMKQKCPTPFGIGSALELLTALIAFDQGWLNIDACKAQRMRRKYVRKTARLQRRDQSESCD